MAVDERLIVASDPNRSGGREAMATMLRMRPRPSAAVCYNDVVAFGALMALGEQGLRAGDDFALIGFDNVLDAAHSNPPLSTVDIRPGELGEQAAAALLARLADPCDHTPGPRRQVVGPRLERNGACKRGARSDL